MQCLTPSEVPIRKGRTAKTANHKLKVLRSVFGDAVKGSSLPFAH